MCSLQRGFKYFVVGDSFKSAVKGLFAKRSNRQKDFQVVANGPLNTTLVVKNSTDQDSRLKEHAGSRLSYHDFGAVCDFVEQADQINLVLCKEIRIKS